MLYSSVFTIPALEGFCLKSTKKYIWLTFVRKTSLLRYWYLSSSYIFLLLLLFSPQRPSSKICRRTLKNCQSLTAMSRKKVSGAHFYLSFKGGRSYMKCIYSPLQPSDNSYLIHSTFKFQAKLLSHFLTQVVTLEKVRLSQCDLLIRSKRLRYLSKLVSKVTDLSSCCSLPEVPCNKRKIWFKTSAAIFSVPVSAM